MHEIIKPIKERVRFLTEHRDLFNGIIRNSTDKAIAESCTQNLPDNSSQQIIQEDDFNQISTQSTITFSNNHQDDSATFVSPLNLDIINEETIDSSIDNRSKENNDGEAVKFPYNYIVPDLPPKIQQIIQKGETNEFRGHTNGCRLSLDAIFTDVPTKYSLL